MERKFSLPCEGGRMLKAFSNITFNNFLLKKKSFEKVRKLFIMLQNIFQKKCLLNILFHPKSMSHRPKMTVIFFLAFIPLENNIMKFCLKMKIRKFDISSKCQLKFGMKLKTVNTLNKPKNINLGDEGKSIWKKKVNMCDWKFSSFINIFCHLREGF